MVRWECPISTKESCWTRGSNPRPSPCQVDAHTNKYKSSHIHAPHRHSWTRASAWRSTNTPAGTITYKNNSDIQDIRKNHWTMKYRSLTYICFMMSIFVSHWSIIPSMTFIHQIVLKIDHWTTKYWSLTYIYFMRSTFVSHWSIIPSMTFLNKIFKRLSKITGLWNVGH